jgi:hypothetical protein
MPAKCRTASPISPDPVAPRVPRIPGRARKTTRLDVPVQEKK